MDDDIIVTSAWLDQEDRRIIVHAGLPVDLGRGRRLSVGRGLPVRGSQAAEARHFRSRLSAARKRCADTLGLEVVTMGQGGLGSSVPHAVTKRWSGMSRDDVFDMVVLRTDVFYVEQRIDEQDFDDADRDERTLHLWIADRDGIAAYLRVVELAAPQQGAARTFGRVAVRANRRNEGLARQLIREVLGRFGDEPLIIHAQSYVVKLYEEFGFFVVGEPFDEAGLPHRTMVRPAH